MQLNKSPAELRSMFGSNLRILAQSYPSISELSRQLGINRTQFNRYLAGESFPRPDVLARICVFFDVDARVLLEPVESLTDSESFINGPELRSYLGSGAAPEEKIFPSGFYRFSRRSFMEPDKFAMGLVYVWRNDAGNVFIRGFEAREAMRQQGLPMSSELREFRGMVMRLENGVGAVISRRNAMTASFNFLTPITSFENNFFTGYVTRTVPENMESERVARMVYEHLGRDLTAALAAGREAGLVEQDKVPSFHMRLLKGQTSFR